MSDVNSAMQRFTRDLNPDLRFHRAAPAAHSRFRRFARFDGRVEPLSSFQETAEGRDAEATQPVFSSYRQPEHTTA